MQPEINYIRTCAGIHERCRPSIRRKMLPRERTTDAIAEKLPPGRKVGKIAPEERVEGRNEDGSTANIRNQNCRADRVRPRLVVGRGSNP